MTHARSPLDRPYGWLRSSAMKLVVQVKLLPTPTQASALAATLRACNEAASWAAEVAFAQGAYKNFDLRKHTYAEVKERWSLGAQAAQHTIKKAADACTTLQAKLQARRPGRPNSRRRSLAGGKPPSFRPDAAQPYDDRMLSWQAEARTISIWTTSGRLKAVGITAGAEQLAMLATHRRGESDLLQRDGRGSPNGPWCTAGPSPSSASSSRTRPAGRACRWRTSIRRTPPAPAPGAATSTRRTGSRRPASLAGPADSLITQTTTAPATSAHARWRCGEAGPRHRPQPSRTSETTGRGRHTTASDAP